jgi:hypothetical protein
MLSNQIIEQFNALHYLETSLINYKKTTKSYDAMESTSNMNIIRNIQIQLEPFKKIVSQYEAYEKNLTLEVSPEIWKIHEDYKQENSIDPNLILVLLLNYQKITLW